MAAHSDISTGNPFAGELFRSLAQDGRLVLDADCADRAIAGLERTLVEVRARLAAVRVWRQSPHPTPALADHTVDAVFADQLAPGRLELATVEIPKYIEALRLARRPTEDH